MKGSLHQLEKSCAKAAESLKARDCDLRASASMNKILSRYWMLD